MNVAVIDVGSNTIRLLVATAGADGPRVLCELGSRVGLGEDVEQAGAISPPRLARAAGEVESFVREARAAGCERIEVVVASPGRQALNGRELLRALADAAGVPVALLSQEDEARLAYRGAVARLAEPPASLAVCDVGGGSTQIAMGTSSEPLWLRSVDVGSLRLTARLLGDEQPGKKAVAAARAEVRRCFDGVVVPLPKTAVAVGGSARALRKLVGRTLGPDELVEAARVLRKQPHQAIAQEYGVGVGRVRTLLAGALIFAEVQERIAIPLEVVRAGLREGKALGLLDLLEAA
jgi:exopolyphosphatase/guanosine-5'-triphosphate,3'-diphosphate pyrophosphatase